MPERETRSIRIKPDVWDDFVQQVIEWEGRKNGELGRHVENALEEYMDHDRFARIEEKVDRILAHTANTDSAHAHTQPHASDSVERAREIYKRLADNHGTIIKDADVARAIEDIAGADERTIEKYKKILKRRSLLFEHPSDSAVWTVERQKWMKWATEYVDNAPTAELVDVCEPYSITANEIVEQLEVEQ